MARILIVDDETNIRTMIRMALMRAGHEVGQAADGPDGLAQFGNGRAWDLVLLDQRMPGMEGLEVLAAMLGRNPDARVIMVTAFGPSVAILFIKRWMQINIKAGDAQ